MNTIVSLQVPPECQCWAPKQLFETLQVEELFEKFKKGEIEGGNDPLRRCLQFGKKMEEMENIQSEVKIKIEHLIQDAPGNLNKRILLQNLLDKIIKNKNIIDAVGQDIQDIKAEDFKQKASEIENSSEVDLENQFLEWLVYSSDEEDERPKRSGWFEKWTVAKHFFSAEKSVIDLVVVNFNILYWFF